MTSDTATATDTDIAVVRAGFEALARGDAPAFGELFHADATWNHRNDDRLGGIKHGLEEYVKTASEKGNAKERFGKYDLDKDGFLTREEFLAPLKK